MTCRYKIFALLLITLLSFTCPSYSMDENSCVHDQIEQEPPGSVNIEEAYYPEVDVDDSNRVLSSYSNMRFYPYFGFLGSTSLDSYIKNELVPPVVAYYEAALKIKYPVVGNLKLDSSVKTICGATTPSILTSTGVAADFFMYYDTYDTDEFLAYSTSCYTASGSKRTIIARIMFNINRFPNPAGNVLIHEKNTYTVLHETMHTLGFDSSQFNNFLDANGKPLTGHVKSVKIGGETRTVLDVSPLTDKLRDFYGCSSLPGAIMENDGGSGTAKSHFETKYFMIELMTSSGDFGRRISEYSLSLLEGTGWYVPDYSFAEPFFYGQGQGCAFINNVCSSSGAPKFDEYCSGSGRGCAPTGRAGGTCSTSSLMENCRAYEPSNSIDCDNDDGADDARLPDLQVFGRGVGSKCFTGTLNSRQSSSNSQTSFCFKYTCSGSGTNTQLQMQVGSHTLTCTQEGEQTIDGYYGVVNCPDPLTFCNTVGVKFCPRNCMGRGTCVSGKCQCNSGFTGVDCAMNN